jgi:transposase InsO family protein
MNSKRFQRLWRFEDLKVPYRKHKKPLHDEFLNGHLFESLLEAQVLLEDWRHEYNHERLRSSLCYLTPVEFKEM